MITIIDYLQYPFFSRALIAGSLIALILSWMSGYVVLRRQVLFTHALSNMGFLGVAIALLCNWPVTPVLTASCIIAAYLVNAVQQKNIFHSDSLLEIFSQLGLALAIIIIAFFPGYRVNIEQYLFGDILGITQFDLIAITIAALSVGVLLMYSHNTFLKIALSDSLSHTLVKQKKLWHMVFIGLLAMMIAFAMKIIGVLLVAAFTTITSNTAKLIAVNLRMTFVLSSIIGVIATVLGLLISAQYNLPTGPLIVVVLVSFWAIAILFKKK